MKIQLYSYEAKPLHVSGKCSEEVWPSEKLEDAWGVFGDVINDFYEYQSVQTHAFVLMSNHYHWLCSTPTDLEEPARQKLFNWFQESVEFDFTHSLRMDYICETGQAPDPLFIGPPKVLQIDHIEAYRNTYAYIYKNPVAAGIVKRAEHYPFSTLPYVLGHEQEELGFRCSDNMNLIYHPARVLNFINQDNYNLTLPLDN